MKTERTATTAATASCTRDWLRNSFGGDVQGPRLGETGQSVQLAPAGIRLAYEVAGAVVCRVYLRFG